MTQPMIDVEDPATGEVIGHVPAGGPEEVDDAVAGAEAAFREWRWLSAYERADLMHEAAAKTLAHSDELVDLLIAEQGKPRSEQAEEVEWTANTLRYYAELGRHERGRVAASGEPRNQLNLVLKEPYGVVGAIVPWNFPLLLLVWKLAPALAAGNTVVVKPSELTPLATTAWVERCLDGLPDGVVQVVTGTGEAAGEALVAHPGVRVIAFTGSLETGRRIASVAAPMMKHTHLELGGKDAFVIGPDADPTSAVEALLSAALWATGQVCTSAERVYAPEPLRNELLERLEARVAELKVGPSADDDTDIGPMIGEPYRAKVEAHVAEATARGATLVAGGERLRDRGYFYAPTVLADVDHGMTVMREETFGPVIPVMGYDDFDRAIALAGDSEYGLGATLRSTDPVLVKRFFEEVKVGTVWINDPLTDTYGGPFGGMKSSGGARELGSEGLEAFRETKHVHWDFSEEPKDFWYPYGRG